MGFHDYIDHILLNYVDKQESPHNKDKMVENNNMRFGL
jgi:hypothetical protein